MLTTKSFFPPSLCISTITTSSACFFKQNSMSFVIAILKTLETYYTALINSAFEAFNNYIRKSILVSPDFISLAHTDFSTSQIDMLINYVKNSLIFFVITLFP